VASRTVELIALAWKGALSNYQRQESLSTRGISQWHYLLRAIPLPAVSPRRHSGRPHFAAQYPASMYSHQRFDGRLKAGPA